jgi:tetratricopeptide (TPR) repeat protein
MLAGLPAFHGPTQESTIALRFKHAPRDISVYRPGISQAIERVIQKAMSLSPADRYSNMGEFVKAFDVAVAAPWQLLGASAQPQYIKLRRRAIGIAVAAAVVSSVAVLAAKRGWIRGLGVPTDSTQVAVLPIETGGATANGSAPFELFHTALRRWQDLHVVSLDRTLDVLTKRPAGRLTFEDLGSIAVSLGARRLVLVKPTQTPTGPAVFAEYRDVVDGSLHYAQVDLPSDSSRVAAAYAALADSMVLRGGSDGGEGGTTGPRHLFATQAFIRAASARDQWDLTRADSELDRAVSLDSSFSRAYLWQAQQRSWEGREAQDWVVLADRALRDTSALTPTERLMGRGLALLGRARYPEACSAYKNLIRADSMNFAGWYGLGECNRNDRVVVADARSPSAWSFRSSLRQTVTSYVRAFQLIPATYRGFEGNGYKRLRDLLFMSGNRSPDGHSLGEPVQDFSGIPTIVGDSITLIPWPQSAVLSQSVSNSGSTAVVTRLRAAFDTVVSRWASTFPRSAATKEAVANTLEMRGEPAALDTIAVAEHLTQDPSERVRLAAARLSMELKFAASGPGAGIEEVLKSADSLLDHNQKPATADIAGFLAPVAAMTGQCQRTAQLLRHAALVSGADNVPADVVRDIAELEAYVVVGCHPPDARRRLDDIDKRFVLQKGIEPLQRAKYRQLNVIVRAMVPLDSLWVTRLADSGGRTIVAERELLQTRRDSARARLDEVARVRHGLEAGRVTADAVVPEARAWLLLADTTRAIASLESALASARMAIPLQIGEPRYNAGRMGFLIQAYALHAQLLANRDRVRARQSARVAATMWSHADVELRPIVARLREIMK